MLTSEKNLNRAISQPPMLSLDGLTLKPLKIDISGPNPIAPPKDLMDILCSFPLRLWAGVDRYQLFLATPTKGELSILLCDTVNHTAHKISDFKPNK